MIKIQNFKSKYIICIDKLIIKQMERNILYLIIPGNQNDSD